MLYVWSYGALVERLTLIIKSGRSFFFTTADLIN